MGYVTDWKPYRSTELLLGRVECVLDEYRDHLPLTVRQVYYRMVAAFGYAKGKPFATKLSEALVMARRAGRIAFEDIRDDGISGVPPWYYEGAEHFWEVQKNSVAHYTRNRQQDQPVRIEVWCEAAGMIPQLQRIASPYSIPTYSSGGFNSLTAIRQVVDSQWFPECRAGERVRAHFGRDNDQRHSLDNVAQPGATPEVRTGGTAARQDRGATAGGDRGVHRPRCPRGDPEGRGARQGGTGSRPPRRRTAPATEIPLGRDSPDKPPQRKGSLSPTDSTDWKAEAAKVISATKRMAIQYGLCHHNYGRPVIDLDLTRRTSKRSINHNTTRPSEVNELSDHERPGQGYQWVMPRGAANPTVGAALSNLRARSNDERTPDELEVVLVNSTVKRLNNVIRAGSATGYDEAMVTELYEGYVFFFRRVREWKYRAAPRTLAFTALEDLHELSAAYQVDLDAEVASIGSRQPPSEAMVQLVALVHEHGFQHAEIAEALTCVRGKRVCTKTVERWYKRAREMSAGEGGLDSV